MSKALKCLIVFCFISNFKVFAEVQLRDIGVIGLASHDIFSWDRKTETNTENGRIDLSTIFDYDQGKSVQKGGAPKNSENAPVYSITMDLVDYYNYLIKTGFTHEEARKLTVKKFRAEIIASYERVSGLKFPNYTLDEKVTNTEQAVLRAMHDLLPGRAKLFARKHQEFILTDFKNAKLRLKQAELNQKLKTFDGDYDDEYKNIKIPFTKKMINLKEVDRKFIEKFSPYKQAEMLAELKEVGLGNMTPHEVSFLHHLEALFAKAFEKNGNNWAQP